MDSFSKWTEVFPTGYLQILEKKNSMSFPDFPDHLNRFFQTTIKCKRDLTNHRISQFSSFLAQLQNILFEEHGDWLHPIASHSVKDNR